ncbi:MAG: DNA repair protein RecN [Candidatus Dormibacteria bacterium]
MLAEVRVENLAVIENTAAEFGRGLNVLTGETGAGKSVLLAALALTLGSRADASLVRRGQERGLVTAAFIDPPEPVQEACLRLGVRTGEALLLSRELASGGRSSARANGSLIPAAALQELSATLVDLQGQGASSAWLRESQQREGLDDLAGTGALEARRRLAELWGDRDQVRARLTELDQRHARQEAELEQARADLAELDAADPRPGELEDLVEERGRLRHGAGLRQAASRLREALAGGAQGAGAPDLLAGALQEARPAQGIDPALDRLLGEAQGALERLRELQLALSAYLTQVPDDAGRLELVEERLELLDRLGRRHGGTLERALARRQEASEIVALGEEGGGERKRLTSRLGDLEAELGQVLPRLSELRRRAAAALEEAITADLRRMLMPRARFRVRLWQVEDASGVAAQDGRLLWAGPEGWDRVSFELAANPGDPPRPLAEVASGGELARAALALFAQLSGALGVATVIFDEIDQGLGGEAANRVGDLLREVARVRQVVCITHLAALAARADRHLVITKVERQGRACSQVEAVSGPRRVEELARLLAGEATPAAARAHAQELLQAVGAGQGGT